MGGSCFREIKLEETSELLVRAFQNMDFSEADRTIARNTVKEANALRAVRNGLYDAVCWASPNGSVAHSITLSPRDGVSFQFTTFHNGEAWGHINVRKLRDIEFPEGARMIAVSGMGPSAEETLGRVYGIALTEEAEHCRVESLGEYQGREDLFESVSEEIPAGIESLDQIMDAKVAEAAACESAPCAKEEVER